MKRNTLLIIILILITIKIFAQVPITPNGAYVTISTAHSDNTQSEINFINEQMRIYFSSVIQIESAQPYHGRFNCHFFAWHNNQGYTE
jgi:hypothetical protein